MRFSTFALISPSFLGSAIAADCFPGSGSGVNPDDVQRIAEVIRQNAFNTPETFPMEIKAQHEFGFTVGSARFCLTNEFLFDNTHVSQGDLVFAVQNLHDHGHFQVKGDTGLATDVVIASASSGFCK
ncbi:hypothetical protein NM208_g6842 [Fusarium decemcellulare]|uniref:Uncharacterized protein n=1 Tax=Fusarium decemcellulare TaxID=57161 RepID=A0ACC1SBJ0_9HYPO|nr:hypothetical protein NM208_g6842 [Fusarium decemcellulare]